MLPFTDVQPDLRGLIAAAALPSAATTGFYQRTERTWAEQSGQQFVEDVYRCGRSLADQGLEPGEIAIITVGDNASVLRCFFGAIAIGAIPVILPVRPAFDDPAAAAGRLDSILASLPPNPAVVIAEGTASKSSARAPHRVLELPSDLDAYAGSVISAPPAAPTDIAYLQLSSGSTRDPRAIAVTHGAAVAQLSAISERCELRPDDTFLIWLPLYHDLALVAFALLPMAMRTSMYFMTPFDFLGDPAGWLRGITEREITTTAAPNFGLRHAAERIRDRALDGIDLSSLRRVCCGAEPIKAATFRSFIARFSSKGLRDDVLVPTYGMAETTLMLTMPARQRPVVTAVVDRSRLRDLGAIDSIHRSTLDVGVPFGPDEVELVGVGTPGLGTDIWIVDEHGTRVDRDLACGEIVTRTPSLTAGYLRPDGGIDPFDRDGFHTGDIGFLDRGDLFIVDRLKNTIIRSGQSISAAAIEDLVADLSKVPADSVVVIDSALEEGEGRITALIELARNDRPDVVAERIVSNSHRFRPALDDLVLLRPNALPRTTSGKKRHRSARLMLGDGTLRVDTRVQLTPCRTDEAGDGTEPIDLTRLEVEAACKRLITAIAHRRIPDVVVSESSVFTSDLGIDSVDMYELAVSLEDHFDIALHESDLRDVERVGELTEICITRRRIGPAAAGSGITAAIEAATEPFPQLLRVADDQKGRQVFIDGRWVTDFASCNYLGLDLHPDVINSIEPALRQWGVHPSWTRAVASPAPYRELEARLAALIGVDDTVVFPALTLLHLSALPMLATPTGTLFIDRFAHQSLHQAGELASARGSTVATFDHHDLDGLDHRLHNSRSGPRVIVVDGVYSMSGGTAPLVELVALAERHDATIYIDDAHGFGLLGENPTDAEPFGHRGNGVVNHLGLTYERIVYCAGLSKAYSSMGAFVAARTPAERRQFEAAATLVFSGPVPTASLASAMAGLDVNDAHGDDIRRHLFALTDRLIDGTRRLGLNGHNANRFPIVNLTIGSVDKARQAAEILWEHGLLVTPSVFPAVPLDASGVRFTVTAANTDDDITQALDALAAVAASITTAVDQVSSSATMA